MVMELKPKERALYGSVVWAALAVVLLSSSLVFAGDIVHQDDIAPKRPGCDNNFVLVKLLNFFFFFPFLLLLIHASFVVSLVVEVVGCLLKLTFFLISACLQRWHFCLYFF